MSYLRNLLIAVDQLINTVGGGWPDETLSSRAWRWHRDGRRKWPRRFIDRLFFFDPDHCEDSYQSERTSRYLPPEFRNQVSEVRDQESTLPPDFAP